MIGGGGTVEDESGQRPQESEGTAHCKRISLFLFLFLVVVALIPFDLLLIDTLCIAQNYSFSNVPDPVFFFILRFGDERKSRLWTVDIERELFMCVVLGGFDGRKHFEVDDLCRIRIVLLFLESVQCRPFQHHPTRPPLSQMAALFLKEALFRWILDR